MKYKLKGEVEIEDDECEDFENSLKFKDFDFFRFLADNEAKITITKIIHTQK